MINQDRSLKDQRDFNKKDKTMLASVLACF